MTSTTNNIRSAAECVCKIKELAAVIETSSSSDDELLAHFIVSLGVILEQSESDDDRAFEQAYGAVAALVDIMRSKSKDHSSIVTDAARTVTKVLTSTTKWARKAAKVSTLSALVGLLGNDRSPHSRAVALECMTLVVNGPSVFAAHILLCIADLVKNVTQVLAPGNGTEMRRSCITLCCKITSMTKNREPFEPLAVFVVAQILNQTENEEVLFVRDCLIVVKQCLQGSIVTPRPLVDVGIVEAVSLILISERLSEHCGAIAKQLSVMLIQLAYGLVPRRLLPILPHILRIGDADVVAMMLSVFEHPESFSSSLMSSEYAVLMSCRDLIESPEYLEFHHALVDAAFRFDREGPTPNPRPLRLIGVAIMRMLSAIDLEQSQGNIKSFPFLRLTLLLISNLSTDSLPAGNRALRIWLIKQALDCRDERFALLRSRPLMERILHNRRTLQASRFPAESFRYFVTSEWLAVLVAVGCNSEEKLHQNAQHTVMDYCSLYERPSYCRLLEIKILTLLVATCCVPRLSQRRVKLTVDLWRKCQAFLGNFVSLADVKPRCTADQLIRFKPDS